MSLPNSKIITDLNLRSSNANISYDSFGNISSMNTYIPQGTITSVLTYGTGTLGDIQVSSIQKYLNGTIYETKSLTYGNTNVSSIIVS